MMGDKFMKKGAVFTDMIFLILLVINLLPVLFLKTPKKYGVLCISLWILLLAGLVIWRMRQDNLVQLREKEYYESAGTKSYGDFEKSEALDEARDTLVLRNEKIIDWIGFQTLVTFILLLIGSYKTKHKRYRQASWFFGFCLFCWILLKAMMGIIPPGGMIGQASLKKITPLRVIQRGEVKNSVKIESTVISNNII
jgi:F0F1-type ATP synthase membrane subunit a